MASRAGSWGGGAGSGSTVRRLVAARPPVPEWSGETAVTTAGRWRSPTVAAVSRRRHWRELPVGLLMIAPSAVILAIFVVYPMVEAVLLGALRCVTQGDDRVSNGLG